MISMDSVESGDEHRARVQQSCRSREEKRQYFVEIQVDSRTDQRRIRSRFAASAGTSARGVPEGQVGNWTRGNQSTSAGMTEACSRGDPEDLLSGRRFIVTLASEGHRAIVGTNASMLAQVVHIIKNGDMQQGALVCGAVDQHRAGAAQVPEVFIATEPPRAKYCDGLVERRRRLRGRGGQEARV